MKLGTLSLVILIALTSRGMAQDNLVGIKWKTNLEKSKYDPNSGRRSGGVLTYEAKDGGYIVTFESVNAQGSPTKEVFGPYKLDGRPYPVTGGATYDATSYKMIDDATTEIVRYKEGKPIHLSTRVLSPDGKTLTFTTTGTMPGQFLTVAVYERQ